MGTSGLFSELQSNLGCDEGTLAWGPCALAAMFGASWFFFSVLPRKGLCPSVGSKVNLPATL